MLVAGGIGLQCTAHAHPVQDNGRKAMQAKAAAPHESPLGIGTRPIPVETAQPTYAMPRPLWPDELRGAGGPKPWLWHGYLAPGSLTLLTSLWKAGKTTLISVLLSRLHTGGSFAGLALAPGNAVVVSEEGAAVWD